MNHKKSVHTREQCLLRTIVLLKLLVGLHLVLPQACSMHVHTEHS